MEGTHELMAQMLYGTGMRLMECVRFRVKDVEFERAEIVVRDGKGAKDHVTMLPQSVIAPLRGHLEHRRAVYEDDLRWGKRQRFICRMRWSGSVRMRPRGGVTL